MSDKYKVSLYDYDYDKRERVPEGEVSVSQVAKCATHENFVYLLDCYLNYGGKEFREGKEVGSDLRNTHRTLQRSAVAFALGLLVGISEQEHTDGRNETAIATAKKIKQMVESGELPLGMYI